MQKSNFTPQNLKQEIIKHFKEAEAEAEKGGLALESNSLVIRTSAIVATIYKESNGYALRVGQKISLEIDHIPGSAPEVKVHTHCQNFSLEPTYLLFDIDEVVDTIYKAHTHLMEAYIKAVDSVGTFELA